jgi:lysophospholipase L1-like esterase
VFACGQESAPMDATGPATSAAMSDATAGATMEASAGRSADTGFTGPQPMAAGSEASNAGSAAPNPTAPVTVYLAGDSTVSTYADTASPRDQAGWRQMLHEYVSDAAVDNRAIRGCTARRFIDDGKLDEIWQDIHAGDYLLVQFGTNDRNRDGREWNWRARTGGARAREQVGRVRRGPASPSGCSERR